MIIKLVRTSRVKDGLWKLRFSTLSPFHGELITTVGVHNDGDMEQTIKEGAQFAIEHFRYMDEFNEKQK